MFGGEASAAVGAKGVEEKPSGVGKKRTREEIVQQLKRQRTGAGAESGGSAAPVQETLGSKVSVFREAYPRDRKREEYGRP